MADWMVALPTEEADRALPAIGTELERLGWRREPKDSPVLSYEKSNWGLLASSMSNTKIPSLRDGDSLLSVVVTDRSPTDQQQP
ncbi:hypothetical protein [Streptomyces sp. LARHCF249]